MADIRQSHHFNPENGWMNDPNGLINIDGTYHIFYQYYPDDTKWGPMHWGHAVSEDLTHFKHLPIALFPTDEEYVFSGSAVIDEENISGLSADGKRVLLLFYTMHNPITGEQQQGLAYASEPFLQFKRYEGNPVIKNDVNSPDYKKDFRDPKVVKNPVLGGYTMVLAAGEKIEFYHSTDFINWKYSGEFRPADCGAKGLCECPDLMFFDMENGTKKAVLSMSLIITMVDGSEGHIMPYFVGDYDGEKFVAAQEFDVDNNLLDYGRDNYAMVSFNQDTLHLEKQTWHLMMGWGENWNDARVNINTEYFGKLTCARKVELKYDELENRYVLFQHPVISIEDSENCWHKIDSEKNQEVIYDNGYVEKFAEGGRKVYSDNERGR